MPPRKWLLVELPITDYPSVLTLQEKIVAAKIRGEFQENVLIILEHLPVFTLGYRGGLTNLKVSQSFLENRHIAIVKTRRGGDITYHGPGQLIAYPIIALNRQTLTIPDYINALEEVMRRTSFDFNVSTSRSPKNPGLWTGSKKIGSVGISVRRSVSCHGLALNISTDLTPFSWINPCGLAATEVTSIALESGTFADITQARTQMIDHFRSIFSIDFMTSDQTPPWLTELTSQPQ